MITYSQVAVCVCPMLGWRLPKVSPCLVPVTLMWNKQLKKVSE